MPRLNDPPSFLPPSLTIGQSNQDLRPPLAPQTPANTPAPAGDKESFEKAKAQSDKQNLGIENPTPSEPTLDRTAAKASIQKIEARQGTGGHKGLYKLHYAAQATAKGADLKLLSGDDFKALVAKSGGKGIFSSSKDFDGYQYNAKYKPVYKDGEATYLKKDGEYLKKDGLKQKGAKGEGTFKAVHIAGFALASYKTFDSASGISKYNHKMKLALDDAHLTKSEFRTLEKLEKKAEKGTLSESQAAERNALRLKVDPSGNDAKIDKKIDKISKYKSDRNSYIDRTIQDGSKASISGTKMIAGDAAKITSSGVAGKFVCGANVAIAAVDVKNCVKSIKQCSKAQKEVKKEKAECCKKIETCGLKSPHDETQTMSLKELKQEYKDISRQLKQGTLTPDQLSPEQNAILETYQPLGDARKERNQAVKNVVCNSLKAVGSVCAATNIPGLSQIGAATSASVDVFTQGEQFGQKISQGVRAKKCCEKFEVACTQSNLKTVDHKEMKAFFKKNPDVAQDFKQGKISFEQLLEKQPELKKHTQTPEQQQAEQASIPEVTMDEVLKHLEPERVHP